MKSRYGGHCSTIPDALTLFEVRGRRSTLGHALRERWPYQTVTVVTTRNEMVDLDVDRGLGGHHQSRRRAPVTATP
jgi:hypothetical protein